MRLRIPRWVRLDIHPTTALSHPLRAIYPPKSISGLLLEDSHTNIIIPLRTPHQDMLAIPRPPQNNLARSMNVFKAQRDPTPTSPTTMEPNITTPNTIQDIIEEIEGIDQGFFFP